MDLSVLGRIGAGFNVVAGPAEVRVRAEDAERARDLLADVAAAPTNGIRMMPRRRRRGRS